MNAYVVRCNDTKNFSLVFTMLEAMLEGASVLVPNCTVQLPPAPAETPWKSVHFVAGDSSARKKKYAMSMSAGRDSLRTGDFDPSVPLLDVAMLEGTGISTRLVFARDAAAKSYFLALGEEFRARLSRACAHAPANAHSNAHSNAHTHVSTHASAHASTHALASAPTSAPTHVSAHASASVSFFRSVRWYAGRVGVVVAHPQCLPIIKKLLCVWTPTNTCSETCALHFAGLGSCEKETNISHSFSMNLALSEPVDSLRVYHTSLNTMQQLMKSVGRTWRQGEKHGAEEVALIEHLAGEAGIILSRG